MAIGSAIQPLLVKLGGDGSLLRKTYRQAIIQARSFEQKTRSSLRGVSNTTKTLQSQVRVSMEKAGASLNKFARNAKTNFLKAQRSTLGLRTALTKVALKAKAVGVSLTAMGRTLALRVTAPLALLAGISIKSFASFDQAMIESTSIMKVTRKEIEQMRDTALSLSKESAQAPAELARSFFFLASAGFDAERSIAALPLVTKFATAGAFDMALATDLLTDAQSALGLASKDAQISLTNMTRVADVLVKANTLANASVEQFSVALTSKAGAALKSFNKDVEEGVAVLAAMADQGIKAQLAGNALARILLLLSKASQDNQEAFELYNFTVFDTTGKMRNMADIIGNLEDSLRGMTDQQRVAALTALGFEARVQAVILPLLGTSKAIREYERQLRQAGGTTRDVAEKQMKSFTNQMKQVRNQLIVTAISVGKTLAPAFKFLASTIQDLAKRWEGLSSNTRKWILIVAGVAATVGPVLIVLGALSQSIVAMTSVIKLASVAFAFGKASILGFGLAIKGLAILGAAAIVFAVADAIGFFGRAAKDSAPQIAMLNRLMENLLEATRSQIDSSKSLSDLEKTRTKINNALDDSISRRFASEKDLLKLEKVGAFTKGGAIDRFFGAAGGELEKTKSDIKLEARTQKDLLNQLEQLDKVIESKKKQRGTERVAEKRQPVIVATKGLTDFEEFLKRTDPEELAARQRGETSSGQIAGRRVARLKQSEDVRLGRRGVSKVESDRQFGPQTLEFEKRIASAVERLVEIEEGKELNLVEALELSR